jgi:hypothetical protein
VIYVKGVALGLALFTAWLAAMVGIVFAALYIEYWLWAIFPVAFISFGICIVRGSQTLNTTRETR